MAAFAAHMAVAPAAHCHAVARGTTHKLAAAPRLAAGARGSVPAPRVLCRYKPGEIDPANVDDDWTDVSMVDVEQPYDSVKQYMTEWDLLVAHPEEDMNVVLNELGRVFRVPVVNDDGKLVGMISRRDIARLTKEGTKVAGPVHEYMVPAVSVLTNCHVAEAASLMIDHKLHSVPVVDAGGALRGMLSKVDIFVPSIKAIDLIMSPDNTYETLRDIGATMSWEGDLDDAIHGGLGVSHEVIYDGHDRFCRSLVHMLSLRAHGQLVFVDSRGMHYDHREHHGITPRNNHHRIHTVDADGSVLHGIDAVDMLYRLLGMGTDVEAATNPLVGGAAKFVMKLPTALRSVAQIQHVEEVALYKHFADQGKRGYMPM